VSSLLNCERDRHALVILEHRVEVLTETIDLLLYKGENEVCCAGQFLTSAKTKLYRVLRYPVARNGYNCIFTGVQLTNL
jgi:hypothetical protein